MEITVCRLERTIAWSRDHSKIDKGVFERRILLVKGRSKESVFSLNSVSQMKPIIC
jgi:hypothetical protein